MSCCDIFCNFDFKAKRSTLNFLLLFKKIVVPYSSQSTAVFMFWCVSRSRGIWTKQLLANLRVHIPQALRTANIFLHCGPQNDRRRAVCSLFKIDRLSFFLLLSCSSLSRFLILQLLLSSNVVSDSGPICPLCAGNVTWRGRSVQSCTCLKWFHLRLFLSPVWSSSSFPAFIPGLVLHMHLNFSWSPQSWSTEMVFFLRIANGMDLFKPLNNPLRLKRQLLHIA